MLNFLLSSFIHIYIVFTIFNTSFHFMPCSMMFSLGSVLAEYLLLGFYNPYASLAL